MPSAGAHGFFTAGERPVSSADGDLPEGVRVRVQQKGETFEQWIPAGWQIAVPTPPNQTMMVYGWKMVGLPIGLELLDFEVKRNEGSDTPAGFKSTLRISTAEGESAAGQCWMNNPFSFPGAWLHTWTGLTYKISQASWNPDNLGQSTVQILRDPGWLLKWIGSLLVVIGIFLLFYLQPCGNKPKASRSRRRPSIKNPGHKGRSNRGNSTLVSGRLSANGASSYQPGANAPGIDVE